MLHHAAYRSGLGNSIFCPEHKVGKLSSETLQHFLANNFTTNRCAVAGVNVEHKYLVGFAQNLGLESGDGPKHDCQYRGGTDERLECGGSHAAVAVGANGSSFANQQEAMAAAVLQHAGGLGASTKRGAQNGALTKVIAAAAPHTASVTLNALYTDNGLFGFVASGPSKEIGRAVEAGVKTLKNCSPTDDDIARGKAALKAKIACMMDSESGMIDAMATQSCLMGNVWSAAKAMEAVDSVTSADVKSVSFSAYQVYFEENSNFLICSVF